MPTLGATSISRRSVDRRWEDSPEGYPQTPPYVWWRWNDSYDAEASREHLEQTARALSARANGSDTT
jgi:hypothetical protein